MGAVGSVVRNTGWRSSGSQYRSRKSSDGREAVSEDTRLRELAEHDARELRRQLHEALRVIRELRALLEERE
jgi:hypothetical protein